MLVQLDSDEWQVQTVTVPWQHFYMLEVIAVSILCCIAGGLEE